MTHTCNEQGCEAEEIRGWGWCEAHYQDNPEAVTCPIIVCTKGADHLFESCPHYQREAARFGENAMSCNCEGKVCDPLDESVCGWCRRVWRAREKNRV